MRRRLYDMVACLALVAPIDRSTAQPGGDAHAARIAAVKGVPDSLISAQVDEYVARLVAMHDFSGSVLITRGGQVIVRKGYGTADKELTVPAQPSMAFGIGSVTKTFTATAVELLAQDGKLDLHAPLAKYLPAFRPGDNITIEQVLAHQSGLPDYYLFPEFAERRREPITPSTFLRMVSAKPLDFQPGTKSNYSNTGYAVLAQLVASVSGMSFAEFVADRLLRPLSMGHTGDVHDDDFVASLAPGYDAGFAPAFVQPAARDSWSWLEGNGSMYSTADDLNRWLEATRTERLVPWKALAAPYGWGRHTRFGRDLLEQNGRIPTGYTTYIGIYLDDDVAIVVLSNIQVDVAERMGADMAAIVFGARYAEPAPRPSAASAQDSTLLAPLAGKYQIAPGFVLTVAASRRGLLLAGPDGALLPMDHISRDRFFLRTLYVPITFARDSAGVVTQLHWGDSAVAQRLP